MGCRGIASNGFLKTVTEMIQGGPAELRTESSRKRSCLGVAISIFGKYIDGLGIVRAT